MNRRWRPRQEPAYSRESDLCADFAEVARAAGWIVYPEIDHWDLVLVAEDGFQVGVQAKLQAGWMVLWQATQPSPEKPDRRAILVPKVDHRFRNLAHRFGVHVFEASTIECARRWSNDGALARATLERHPDPPLMPQYQVPRRRLALPSIVAASVVAGSPCPRRLTPWRESALLLCALLQRKERVTASEIRLAGLKPSNLVQRNHVVRVGWTEGKPREGLYARGSAEPLDLGWERERDEIWALRGAVFKAADERTGSRSPACPGVP